MVDIVLIAIIGLFGVLGLRRGLLSQVVFVVAFLVGVWLTIRGTLVKYLFCISECRRRPPRCGRSGLPL